MPRRYDVPHGLISEFVSRPQDPIEEITFRAESLKTEAEFFTQQVYKEVKRVFSIDYEIGRSVSVSAAEMLLRFTYQVSRIHVLCIAIYWVARVLRLL